MEKRNMFVKGSVIQSFKNICINLKYMTDDSFYHNIEMVDNPNKWYPFPLLSSLFQLINDSYENPDAIFEIIGFKSMQLWYNNSIGHDIMKSGIDFLYLQEDSKGYHSMVKGSPKQTGSFSLEKIDLTQGIAIIFDSTPFDKSFSKGLIIGGMMGAGDIKNVDVSIGDDNKIYINFKQENFNGRNN